MHMLETYKSRDDTFALCEGNLSADNLRVLTVRTCALTYYNNHNKGLSVYGRSVHHLHPAFTVHVTQW